MGDRGNIVVVDEFDIPAVYLYSHWGGYELGDTLATVLSRGQRWDDGSYLARMIFCEMVKGSETGETGFGISTAPPDNEHAYLVVDIKGQRVLIGDASNASTLRERVAADEPDGFVSVPFAEWSRLAAAFKEADQH